MAIELNIIDNSLPAEQMIEKIWQRNVFFIGAYSFLMISVFCGAIIHRFYSFFVFIKNEFSKKKKTNNHRKPCKIQWLEKWICMVKDNFWQILWLMLFFTFMFLSKFIYHTAIIIWWIAKNIVWPLMWFVLAFLFVWSLNNNPNKPKLH